MRTLRLFLILAFLPLLATETPPKEEKPHVEHEASETHPSPLERNDEPTFHKTTESYETAFIKTIVVLVGLLVLVILTVWMIKKISNGRLRSFNSLRSVKILEKRPLSPKSMLYLIEVSGKQVLIAESQLEVRTLTHLDWLEGDKDL
ncbi:MAG: flagellar biosynthetic protein FliO [Chlamydiia bacterium]|nr:flagellar biosynthetic protein FliO [Chlamydiia bacterium]